MDYSLLSPREREIAALVARGMCNKEIARELALRNQTVRNTLTKVYRKTGIRTRTELATRILVSDFAASADRQFNGAWAVLQPRIAAPMRS